MKDVVLAVDGGNSKTHLALVRADGTLLALVRGPLSSPYHLGVDGCVAELERLLDEACEQAEIVRGDGRIAEVAEVLLAGVDFPAEEEEISRAIDAAGWAGRTSVANDTFAVLRAGTDRHSRFPALGSITGDWGGGSSVGLEAVYAAARSEDGRGPKTSLEHAVPAHFGLQSPLELAEAMHFQRIASRRVIELAPVVFREADHDPVAAQIVDRLASEVVALARVSLERLDLTNEPTEVLLGGGLLRAGDGRLLAAIDAGMREVAPAVSVRATASPPIVGAALLGLDELGAGPEAQTRVRAELGAAVEEVEGSRDAVDAEEEDYGYLEVE